MATVTLSSADALLKDNYVGPIVETLNQKTYMLDQIERDTDSIDATGRRAVFPVHRARNRGRGSRGDAGTLPVAGREDDVDAIVYIKRHYYAIEVSDGAIEATKSSEGAFVNLWERESKAVSVNMRKDINRQVWGTGDGVLANLSGSEAMGQTVLSVDSVQYIGIGDQVDVLKRSDGTVAVSNAAVTDIDETAGAQTITVGSALTAAGDTAYGVYVAGSRNNEMDGIRNIVNTGRTLHAIDSTSAANKAAWNAKAFNAGSTVAGESLFEQADDAVGGGGVDEIDVWITTRGIKRRLADQYQSQKRFTNAEAVKIHGGYTAIMVNEKPVIADDDAPKGFAWGINKDAFAWFEQTTPGWLQSKDGQVLHLKDSSTAGQKEATWQAWFRWYAALGCKQPNTNARIYGATDDTPTQAV